jgi:hypothetical protein
VADLVPYLTVASPFAALAVNVLTQVFLLRRSAGSYYMRSMLVGFSFGAFALCLVDVLFLSHPQHLPDCVAEFAVRVLSYAGLSYCYFHFVNLGQSSIRVRIYSELVDNPIGLEIGALKQDYNEKTLVETRLQRLTSSGDVVESDGRYFVGRHRLVVIARILFFAKQFILGKRSEFSSK